MRTAAGATVAVVMGSERDAAVMRAAGEELERHGIAYEVRVLSAHRQPDAVARYAKRAAGRGVKVIIAGAGLAAALPGAIASHTTLPVIGVPLAVKELQGLDALLSMAQMPSGVPVATVGIGAARNAALLAVRILALARPATVPASRRAGRRTRRPQ
ncbi:MAG TPA: 5-(carboxyamino)imidazole ribonucleotide mutase [bacterium]|nr:5-(carboxyamino)imidazole ribonucleotide mutase [bacterium]